MNKVSLFVAGALFTMLSHAATDTIDAKQNSLVNYGINADNAIATIVELDVILKSNGKTVFNPYVSTSNQAKAVASQSATIPYIAQVTRDSKGELHTVVGALEDGTRLTLVPTIKNDGTVDVLFELKLSEVSKIKQEAMGLDLPQQTTFTVGHMLNIKKGGEATFSFGQDRCPSACSHYDLTIKASLNGEPRELQEKNL